MSSISGGILGNEEVMSSLSDDSQTEVVSSLMNSTEKAGFLYAHTIALTPPDMRITESGKYWRLNMAIYNKQQH